MRIGRDGQRFRCVPKGTMDAPACTSCPIEEFPAPLEHVGLASGLDFTWIKRCIDYGRCVGIAVECDEMSLQAVRDTLHGRLGFDLVIRTSEPGLLYVARLGAVT